MMASFLGMSLRLPLGWSIQELIIWCILSRQIKDNVRFYEFFVDSLAGP